MKTQKQNKKKTLKESGDELISSLVTSTVATIGLENTSSTEESTLKKIFEVPEAKEQAKMLLKDLDAESNIHHAKSIEEAINDLQTFFECDMWYSKNAEWKNEKDMLKYLDGHFNILRDEIKRINGVSSTNSAPEIKVYWTNRLYDKQGRLVSKERDCVILYSDWKENASQSPMDMCKCGHERCWHDLKYGHGECRVDVADDPEITCDCDKFKLQNQKQGCGKIVYRGNSFMGESLECGVDFLCDECKKQSNSQDAVKQNPKRTLLTGTDKSLPDTIQSECEHPFKKEIGEDNKRINEIYDKLSDECVTEDKNA